MDGQDSQQQFHPLNVIQPEKWNNIPMCLIDAIRLMTSEIKSNELKVKFIQDKLLETQKRLEKQMKGIERQMSQAESKTVDNFKEVKEQMSTNQKQLNFQISLVSERSSENQYNIGVNKKKIEETNKFVRDTYKVKTEYNEEIQKLTDDVDLKIDVSQTYMKEYMQQKLTDALEIPNLVGAGRKYIDVRAMLKDLHNNYESKAQLLNDIADNKEGYFQRVCGKVIDAMALPAKVKQLIKPEVKQECMKDILAKMDERLNIQKEESGHALLEKLKPVKEELKDKLGILDEKFKISKDNFQKLDKKLTQINADIERRFVEVRKQQISPEHFKEMMRRKQSQTGGRPSVMMQQQSSGSKMGSGMGRTPTNLRAQLSPDHSAAGTSKSRSPPESGRKRSSSKEGPSKHSTVKEFEQGVPGYGQASRPDSRQTEKMSKRASIAASNKSGEPGDLQGSLSPDEESQKEGLEPIQSLGREKAEGEDVNDEESQENEENNNEYQDQEQEYEYKEGGEGEDPMYQEYEYGNEDYQDDYDYKMEARFGEQYDNYEENMQDQYQLQEQQQQQQFNQIPQRKISIFRSNAETQTQANDKPFFGLENVDITKIEPHTMDFLRVLEDELLGIKTNISTVKEEIRLHLNYHYYNDGNTGGASLNIRKNTMYRDIKKYNSFDEVLHELKTQENDKNLQNRQAMRPQSGPRKLSPAVLLRMISRRKKNEQKIKEINGISKEVRKDAQYMVNLIRPSSMDSRVRPDHYTPDSLSMQNQLGQETIQETKEINEEDSPSKRIDKGIDASLPVHQSQSDAIYSVDQLSSDFQHINLPVILKQPLITKKAEIGFETSKPRESENQSNHLRNSSRGMFSRRAVTQTGWKKKVEGLLSKTHAHDI